MIHETEINKWDIFKIKIVSAFKKITVIRNKRQVIDQEAILANHVSDKEIASRISKEFSN